MDVGVGEWACAGRKGRERDREKEGVPSLLYLSAAPWRSAGQPPPCSPPSFALGQRSPQLRASRICEPSSWKSRCGPAKQRAQVRSWTVLPIKWDLNDADRDLDSHCWVGRRRKETRRVWKSHWRRAVCCVSSSSACLNYLCLVLVNRRVRNRGLCTVCWDVEPVFRLLSLHLQTREFRHLEVRIRRYTSQSLNNQSETCIKSLRDPSKCLHRLTLIAALQEAIAGLLAELEGTRATRATGAEAKQTFMSTRLCK